MCGLWVVGGSDVLPGLPPEDSPDRPLVYTEHLTQSLLSEASDHADRSDIFRRELGGVLFDAASLPPFLDAVVPVILVRAEKEVGRIHTGGFIASVADLKLTRIDTVGEPIHQTMRVVHVADPQLSVTPLVATRIPQPAVFKSSPIYLRIKSFTEIVICRHRQSFHFEKSLWKTENGNWKIQARKKQAKYDRGSYILFFVNPLSGVH